MSENGKVEGRGIKTEVISLNDERPPISNEEGLRRIRKTQKTLSRINQRLGIDEKAATKKMRAEFKSAREN